ncbi:MAG: SCO family protein [Owenweeksia sp.]
MKIQRSDWLKLGAVLLIFTVGLISSYQILTPEPKLPVYNPSELDDRLVDSKLQGKGRNHRVLSFELVNQNGDTINQEHLKGKIYTADFFFTTCPGICKDMAAQKRRLQEVYRNDPDFMMISHTVTPEVDSVPVMQEYAKLQGAIPGKWELLTGDKPQIYKLARQSYFAIFDEGGNGDESDFIHTENFVLIDPSKRIRGFYDGTSKEDVDRLIEDISILKKELKN